MLDTYGAKYHSLKVPRKLVWRPALGQVVLDVAIGDQVLEFQVSPGGRAEPGRGQVAAAGEGWVGVCQWVGASGEDCWQPLGRMKGVC